jgi:hypothetical protein
MRIFHVIAVSASLMIVQGCYSVWGQQSNELWIGFELPKDDRQSDAAHLVASASTRRNVEIQAASNGADKAGSERSAEIGFRVDVSHIPGVLFKLCYKADEKQPLVTTLCGLRPDEATSPDLDQNFYHLPQPGRYCQLGIHVDMENRRLVKDSDGSTIDPHVDRFVHVVCELIKQKVDADQLFWDLLSAEKLDRDDIEFLLDHGANINGRHSAAYPTYMRGGKGWIVVPGIRGVTAIVAAIQSCHPDAGLNDTDVNLMREPFQSRDGSVVRFLLDHGADVNASSSETALIEAVEMGDAEVTKLLLNHGADVNTTNSERMTALLVAAKGGNADIVRLLLERGADVNLRTGDKGETALSVSTKMEVSDLLRQHGAKP